MAHVDAGKTTLSESLLFEAGSIRRIGRVDNADTFLDTDQCEKERGITILSKTARLKFGGTEFILVDTPGHVDFGAEAERALKAMDEAVLLINATDGVQAHTRTLWKMLKSLNIPVFIFVNKMDLPDTDKAAILASLRKELASECADFSDIGSENFYEDCATASEELLELYMEEGHIPDNLIQDAVGERKLFPVFFGSALKQQGVKEFLEGIERFSPEYKRASEFGAYCYKISRDKAGNRLTFLKITGKDLSVKEVLKGEKINEIRLYNGEKYEPVTTAFAGDVCAVTGLKDSGAGMGYGIEQDGREAFLEPVLIYAIRYPSDVDSQTMHRILQEIEEEEPSLNVEYSEATGEIYVRLFGEVQTEILTRRIEDKANIKVTFGTGKIRYKETISDVVEGVGHFEPLRHYAEVHLRMEPAEPGTGLSFDTEVDVNDLALNWQRLILTHLKEKEHKGVLTGSPITDMKITLVAGRAHLKHTEGGDFRQATYRAVRQGLMLADSVLLEPFYFYELTLPEYAVGRAMTDIDRMWGNSVVSSLTKGEAVLTGTAPVATMNGYAKEVAAYTQGKGRLSLALSGYEPCHNTEEVLAARMYNPENDFRNPCDSVFCSHGAGTVVPWSEVYEYMHLPLASMESENKGDITIDYVNQTKQKEIFVTTEEVDAIINKTAYANRKPEQVSHKGISAALREKNRMGGRAVEKPVEYKGTVQKKKYLLVDGYNVVHAWKELSDIAERDINAAAGRLMDIVSNYSGITGNNAILVFDAYKVLAHNAEELDYANIKVVYTKTAETADRYIERYAHENGKKYEITVITSDGVEQVIIRGEGCNLMSSRDFEVDYERRSRELKDMKLSEGIRIIKDDSE